MLILALDPGSKQTGYCLFEDGDIVETGVEDNETMLLHVEESDADYLAIEMIASYGMAVGAEVFDTCVWIGRFYDRWVTSGADYNVHKPILVPRKEVLLHVCNHPRGNDSSVRQAMIDLFGKPGTKKAPGKTYSVKSHAWQALALAVTVSAKIGE
jgi:hypothetical protein